MFPHFFQLFYSDLNKSEILFGSLFRDLQIESIAKLEDVLYKRKLLLIQNCYCFQKVHHNFQCIFRVTTTYCSSQKIKIESMICLVKQKVVLKNLVEKVAGAKGLLQENGERELKNNFKFKPFIPNLFDLLIFKNFINGKLLGFQNDLFSKIYN